MKVSFLEEKKWRRREEDINTTLLMQFFTLKFAFILTSIQDDNEF